ncbi:rRNA biogenesis protein rrp5 [Myotisia sp. PD_48]|nr:rRNA biogenesis protein rrp5 [Myotisia sp. PD_48]
MAHMKRKGNAQDDSGSSAPKKKAKLRTTEGNDSSKSKKTSAPEKNKQQSSNAELKSQLKATTLSGLREEPPAFPRGGGNVLTPLERKQIQIQATKDVLFEQKGGNGADESGDSDDEGAAQATGINQNNAVKSKKRKSKSTSKSKDKGEADEAVRIESLSYKRIVSGSKILGQISNIGLHDISLSLPNNLTGYVPLNAISKALTRKVEGLLKNDEMDVDGEEPSEDEDEAFDLKNYFRIGQYLRASVSATTRESNSKKHIELSIEPQHANSGLSVADLVVNSTVQASVLSVEDHGLIVDLGLDDNSARGFISSRELPAEFNIADVKEGSVFLCIVAGRNPSGSVIKLSADLRSAASIKKSHYLHTAPTINSFLPGAAAEILLTEVTEHGMTGKIMGMIDAVVDIVHSGAGDGKQELTSKYHRGAKIKGRLICTYPTYDPIKLGFSLLDNVVKFSPTATLVHGDGQDAPLISAIVPEVKVTYVDPKLGLYVQLGKTKHHGFVHVSRIADKRVESISPDEGPYNVGSVHEGRIVGFSALDNMYLLSLEKQVIDQPFLRLDDVTVGSVVKGTVTKLLIGPDGIDGLIVSLTDNISGLVPAMHMADTKLQHPEKRFREGLKVSVRVLSVDLPKRQLRLTMKKSLLNNESAIWKDYKDIAPGSQSPGTLVKLQNNGAVVQFYDAVRGFLPVSEMSEAYITDPSQHFTIGQVVNVHALTVDTENKKLVVSCKDPSTFTDDYTSAFDNIHPGLLVSGTVFEKSSDDLLIKLEDSSLVARLNANNVTDGSSSKGGMSFTRIRVGQKLHDLLILSVRKSHRLINVTNKPSLRKAAQEGNLPAKFEDIKTGASVTGLVKNITDRGVFVEFLNGLTGLLPKSLIEDDHLSRTDFGFLRGQTITLKVFSVKPEAERFSLTMKPIKTAPKTSDSTAPQKPGVGALINPVDDQLNHIDDLTLGKLTKAKITSVKDTQLNVILSDNVQGRIDVSEVFDKWEDIKDRKQPLRNFRSKQTLPVRVIGVHDARSHKFLPLSHRSGKVSVFELSTKPSYLQAAASDPLSLDQVKVGDSYIGFVNNIAEDCLWLNISPNVRGRLRVTDLPDDLAMSGNVQQNFPVGSAVKVTVTGVDVDKNRLDLTARDGEASKKISVSDLSTGMILLGRVTKVTERQVLVQINDNIVGAIRLIDMADDYSKVNPANFHKNEALRVCVVDVDIPNQRISFSVRPSKILSSTLPIEDPEITSIDQLKVGQVVRGFVRRVDSIGLFVTLGHNVTAFVRVSDLSDSYLKEWQDEFQVDSLIKGRITLLDKENQKIQMTLKRSALDPNYKPPLTIKDIKVGQIVTGKVRKVEEYGAFIAIDGSANLSGLCHRSEMAEERVADATKLYEKDDIVKAKILKINPEKGQISLGLKVSYLKDVLDDDEKEDGGSESDEDEDDTSVGGVEIEMSSDGDSVHGEEDEDEEDDDVSMDGVEVNKTEDDSKSGGLVTSGFDWTGNGDANDDYGEAGSSDLEDKARSKKKKRRRAEIEIDRTGDLDANGPQSVADYERLLLGEPDSSILWLKYMAFQLELGEVEKAREIAERGLRTISLGQDTEKLNLWVGWLNLENTFGSDDELDEIFKRACQYNDAQEIYERMASIFIQSGKLEKADDLFQAALKKKISSSPDFYLNYATFLFDSLNAPDRGRALLPRAIQSLPSHTHVDLTSRFGQLEFRSTNGDVERGRTVFEGLLSSFPKRVDLWSVLLDLEIKVGDVEQVRRLFERAVGIGPRIASDGSKLASKRLKGKQAKFFFKKWLAFEEKVAAKGDEKMIDMVKAHAAAYVKELKES